MDWGCVLYTGAYYIRDLTVCDLLVNFNKYFRLIGHISDLSDTYGTAVR